MPTIVACPLSFDSHSDPETSIEIGTILEVDGDLGTIAALSKRVTGGTIFPTRSLHSILVILQPWGSVPENITLIVCRLIVVYPQALGSAQSFD